MNLGIIVVYLVNDKNEGLLDLHLRQIEKHTGVPYTIYGSVNRLRPEFRRRLEGNPKVKICDCKTTDLRGNAEHAYYLEILTERAIEDGVSHVVTLHVDSFPVRAGWAEDLSRCLTNSCVFTTIENINTACLFFDRDFYIRYRPTYLLLEREKRSPACKKYLRKFEPWLHSGAGYGFRAYQNGLSWYSMTPSHKTDIYANIYDGIIFHLSSTFYIGDRKLSPALRPPSLPYLRALEGLVAFMRRIIPMDIRLRIRTRFRRFMDRFVDEPRIFNRKDRIEKERMSLLRDPEEYLNERITSCLYNTQSRTTYNRRSAP